MYAHRPGSALVSAISSCSSKHGGVIEIFISTSSNLLHWISNHCVPFGYTSEDLLCWLAVENAESSLQRFSANLTVFCTLPGSALWRERERERERKKGNLRGNLRSGEVDLWNELLNTDKLDVNVRKFKSVRNKYWESVSVKLTSTGSVSSYHWCGSSWSSVIIFHHHQMHPTSIL